MKVNFRAISLCLALALIIMLLVIGCAKPAAPALAPKPTSAPTTHSPKEITIWGYSVGSTAYSLSFALAAIINKGSTWLRAEAVESKGSIPHIKKMAAEPEWRGKVVFLSVDSTNALARKGLPPFETVCDRARAIAVMYAGAVAMVTYDPKINSAADFKGKRVMIYDSTVSNGYAMEVALKEIWGIWNDIKISRGTKEAASRALKDGTVDVGQLAFNGFPGDWIPDPTLRQLQSEKPGFHVVPVFTKDDHATLQQKSGMTLLFNEIPAGTLGAAQPKAFWTLGGVQSWWCDETLNSDVVYEITRLLYENIDKIKEMVPASQITKKNMAMMPIAEQLWHPGALKFYKERGVSVGYNP